MNKHRILIVEDNFLFAAKLEKNLTDWGHEVLGIFENGQSVLSFLERDSPSLILMDINLKGGMNGVEVAQEISDKEIPIIFMTGRTDDETFEAAKKSSAISYLVKPFDLLTLKSLIEFNAFSKLESETPDDDEKYTYFRKNKERIKVAFREIQYVKSDRNYCDIFTDKGTFVLKISLTKLMEQLSDPRFLKSHRSYTINTERVAGLLLSENKIRIGEILIPIGRKYRKEVIEKIASS